MAFEQLYPLCFLHILLLLSCSIFAQTRIFLGSSLTALNDNSSWPSTSGDFAFGFRKIGEDGFLLAIWFNKVTEKTIVWSANGNNLVPEGSKVELTRDGEFVLNDATGKQIWMAGSSATGVANAAMLDTGNFVLSDLNSISLWESFDVPTDTILPTQTININTKLYARFSATNFSKGRFLFKLMSDGNPMLWTTFFPLDSGKFSYWSLYVGNAGFQVIFNQSGSIYLTAKNGSILNMVFANTVSVQDFYQRASIDYDGVLRHYVYPKRTSLRPIMTWSGLSFIPSNICVRIKDVGVGACGFNSVCRQVDQRPICECPHGYAFIDPNDVLKGCKQNFIPQNCDEASLEMDMFDFQEIESTDWPDSKYEYFGHVTEDWCRQDCLGDCFCDVVYYRNNGCWKRRIPLSNGRMDPLFGGKALIKIRKSNSTLRHGGTVTKEKYSSALIRILTVLLCILGFLSFFLPFITYMVVSRIYSRNINVSQSCPSFEEVNLKCFTYKQLHEATNGFQDELGRGAFATVFKGALAFPDVHCVAVKRLNTMVGETEYEFIAEVSAIGRTNHRNLVKLLGFCNEGQNRLLVYEFMSNASLASYLFGESRPNWYSRSRIALGVAKGLVYLHEECSSQIIHCDIKPQNILLDDSFTARISDFGLAKLLRTDQTRTTTGIRGTRGYVATEWFKSIPITVKVDVYSYGILLLEIISCRKHFEEHVEAADQMILADWSYDCYKQKKLHLLLENDRDAINDLIYVEKFVMIALWCIQEDPSLRPSMKIVALMLEGIIEVSAPPDPSSSNFKFS